MAKKGKDEADKFALAQRAFSITLTVFPPIAMARKTAIQLAEKLAEPLDLTDLHLGDEAWVFRRPQASQGAPQGLISVSIDETELTISHDFPTGQLEQFERLAEKVIDAFGEVIKPTHILRTSVELEYTTVVGDDAREMLLSGLQLSSDEEDDKLSDFKRPCHLIGLRLMFPAYSVVKDEDEDGEETKKRIASDEHKNKDDVETKDEAGTEEGKTNAEKGSDWHATVTIQSLMDDPQVVSVEVSGHWSPIVWSKGVKAIPERLDTVSTFLRTQTIEFLKKLGEH